MIVNRYEVKVLLTAETMTKFNVMGINKEGAKLVVLNHLLLNNISFMNVASAKCIRQNCII